MQQLHLVGFTADNRGLIFSARKGSKSGGFVVPLDDRLLERVEEIVARREAEDEGGRSSNRPKSNLSPREIQARLRAGRTIAQVAREAGVEEEWVARWAAPIQAEQGQVVQRAQGLVLEKNRVGPSAVELGEAVRWNMAEKGIVFTDAGWSGSWDAFHLRSDSWVVRFTYLHRKRTNQAEWEVDIRAGALTSRNRQGTELGFVAPGRKRPKPPKTTLVNPVEPEPAPAPASSDVSSKAEAKKPAKRRRPAAKKSAAKKKSTAKKASAKKKSPAKKSPAKKSPAKKTAAKKSAALKKKSPPKKRPAKKTATKKSPAKKNSAVRKSAASKATSSRSTPKKSATKKPAAKRPTVKRSPSRPAPRKKSTAPRPSARKAPGTKPPAASTEPRPTPRPPAPRISAQPAAAQIRPERAKASTPSREARPRPRRTESGGSRESDRKAPEREIESFPRPATRAPIRIDSGVPRRDASSPIIRADRASAGDAAGPAPAGNGAAPASNKQGRFRFRRGRTR